VAVAIRDRAIADTASGRLSIMCTTSVRSQVSARGISDRQSGTAMGFLPVVHFPLQAQVP
jgi:hypothetical protein